MNRRAFVSALAVVAAAPRKLWAMFSSGPALDDTKLPFADEFSGAGALSSEHWSGYSLAIDPEGGAFELRQGARLVRTLPTDAMSAGDILSLRSDGQVSVNGHVI